MNNNAATLEYTMPQTQDIWHPTPSQYTDTGPTCNVVMLSIDVCSHHYFSSWKFSTTQVLCGHALSSWKMKPESTAAIPKGITTGYNEISTQMHSQTLWPSTAIDLISVIFFRAPNLFKLICGTDMNMIRNNLCVFL